MYDHYIFNILGDTKKIALVRSLVYPAGLNNIHTLGILSSKMYSNKIRPSDAKGDCLLKYLFFNNRIRFLQIPLTSKCY